MKKKKKTLIITSLTSCNGCLFSILDLGQTFFKVLEDFELVDFHLIEDKKANSEIDIDIAFIEGTVTREEEKIKLENLRKQAKTLIALGACAHLGNIQKIKNYGNKDKILKYVYPSSGKKIDNRKIEPLSAYVPVDFIIPGCPPNNQEILEVLRQVAIGSKPHLPDRPVCYECQIKNYPCLLLEGKPCLGPMIRGGCEAICLKSNLPCTGCRGRVNEPNEKKMQELLGNKEYERVLEIFGNK
ncbi:MAG: sulfhydrogenase 1 subunit delta [Patescibacteria group bacterium]|nr:sulfhydrogenase 1 subunit delta [Patescibacteria group bacterium]